MRKKILLTGPSGEVGFEVLNELIRRKDQYQARVLSINAKTEGKIFQPFIDEIEIISGDIRDPAVVNRAVQGVDAVIHTAAIIPPLADENPTLASEVNVTGTRNIVEGIKSQQIPPKLLYTSSISVYGDRVKDPENNQ